MLRSRREAAGMQKLEGSTSPHLRGGVTAANLMELQEAASQLRSKYMQRETENQKLTGALCDYAAQLAQLRASEMLLQKKVSLWSSFHCLFVQPLYETRLALGRYQCEEQQLLIQELVRDRERTESLSSVTREKHSRENAALMTRVRRLQEQRDKDEEQLAAAAVQLRKTCKDCHTAQKQVTVLRNDLAFCMDRLEESERERARLQRHLSEHQAALEKKRPEVVGAKRYEEEIRSRDDVIEQLRQTVRDLNTLLAQKLSLASSPGVEKAGGGRGVAQQRMLHEKEPPVSPLSLRCDGCSSEKLHRSIQRLRAQLENEADSPTHHCRLTTHANSPNSLSAMPTTCSPWEVERGSRISVDLQEFLAQELRDPLP
ncbi:hypothetical protein DQ04_03401060 [Trypanosoma grayi]|uniref:hypothetical protein n=1 Tax=Trypanosoma grayi TaxID=71804 RepID=UPI0004F491B8|nr:hypothetical protein DQ04_03401060 [Trypanosoma grayi]KEG10699.1 hypothetical protein DQ04_03401060 [Trypanosoma grayi]